jgi:hypothetical protein
MVWHRLMLHRCHRCSLPVLLLCEVEALGQIARLSRRAVLRMLRLP